MTDPALSQNRFLELEDIALKVREHVLRMAGRGGCFVGSALSCADLLVYLYQRYLCISKSNLTDPNRDYFFLSKGHSAPALYGLFAEIGFMDPGRLDHHLVTEDSVYWHPNRAIPGIEFHAGSLGHLLPVAVGVAMDCKLRGQFNRVVALLGDGELNEGSNWEAFIIARAYRLDNLIVIIDRNLLQANFPTEDLIPLEPLGDKFESFGFSVRAIDGHSFPEMEGVLTALPWTTGKPNVLIARTGRGRGVPSMEGRLDRWFCTLSSQEVEEAVKELHRHALEKRRVNQP